MRNKATRLLVLGLAVLGAGMSARAQARDAGAGQDAGSSAQRPRQGGGEGRMPGTFGKITAISKSSMELAKPDGTTVTVKISSDTQFRKDRQAAKAEDFKVGDIVFVRGDENPDHTVTAQVIGARGAGGPGVSGGQGGGRGFGAGGGFGEQGKDYVMGEVKSVDAPKLTVLRTDNVKQTLELTEETSLHKGRESITMADIQVGDHVMIRGAVENNAFVPKDLMLVTPEQWKQMEQMRQMMSGADGNKPPQPKSNPPHQ